MYCGDEVFSKINRFNKHITCIVARSKEQVAHLVVAGENERDNALVISCRHRYCKEIKKGEKKKGTFVVFCLPGKKCVLMLF